MVSLDRGVILKSNRFLLETVDAVPIHNCKDCTIDAVCLFRAGLLIGLSAR